MEESAFSHDSDLPLEVRGYEISSAQDVFILTRTLDDQLRRALEAEGYVQRENIILSNGHIVDGWVKL